MYRLCSAIIISFFSVLTFAQVTIENAISDLGIVIEAKGDVKTSFALIGGSEDYNIVEVNTSCGCATVVPKNHLIKANERFVLDATYNPVGRIGDFSKAINLKLESNSGKKQEVNLVLKGKVVNPDKLDNSSSYKILVEQIKPLSVSYINQFDTSSFASAEFQNFVNAITYVIDNDNFVSIEADIYESNPDFSEESKNWTLKFKEKLVHSLKSRGYASYQVSYKNNFISEKLQNNAMGKFVLKVKNYSKSDEKTKITYVYKGKKDAGLVEKNVFNALQKKQISQVLDSIQTSIQLISFGAKEFEFYGSHRSKKDIKNFNKFVYKLQKKHPDFSFELNVKQDSIFTIGLKEWENESYFNFLNVNYSSNNPFKIEPKKTTLKTEFSTDFWKNSKLELMMSQLKSESISSFYLNLEIPSVKKKFNRVDWLKKLEMFKNQLSDSLTKKLGRKIEIKSNLSLFWSEYPSNPQITLVSDVKSEISEPIKPYFVQFASNDFKIDSNSFVLKGFINRCVQTINENGTVELIVESSSSNAPTNTELSPMAISLARQNFAIDFLKRAMAKKGIDPNRLIVTERKSLVAGPKYRNDYFEKKEVYQKFQYLKIIPKQNR